MVKTLAVSQVAVVDVAVVDVAAASYNEDMRGFVVKCNYILLRSVLDLSVC